MVAWKMFDGAMLLQQARQNRSLSCVEGQQRVCAERNKVLSHLEHCICTARPTKPGTKIVQIQTHGLGYLRDGLWYLRIRGP